MYRNVVSFANLGYTKIHIHFMCTVPYKVILQGCVKVGASKSTHFQLRTY
jgi:hypothetical protein